MTNCKYLSATTSDTYYKYQLFLKQAFEGTKFKDV